MYISVVPTLAIHHRDVTYSCQWVQRPARVGWTEAVYDRESGGDHAAAQVTYVLQPYWLVIICQGYNDQTDLGQIYRRTSPMTCWSRN